MISFQFSPDNNFLGFDLVGADEAQHIDTGGGEARSRKSEVRMDFVAEHLSSHQVDHLDSSIAVDDEVAIVDVRETIVFWYQLFFDIHAGTK